MAGEGFELSSTIRFNGTITEVVLDVTHFNYPWILLFIFLTAFVANSILSAQPSAETVESIVTGPGGKPLPRSAKKLKEAKENVNLKDFSPGRKLLFIWLSAGVIITLVANATNIVAHALTKRENGWWCGEATAVSRKRKHFMIDSLFANLPISDICLRFGVLLQPLLDLLSRYNSVSKYSPSAYMGGCAHRGTGTVGMYNRFLLLPARCQFPPER